MNKDTKIPRHLLEQISTLQEQLFEQEKKIHQLKLSNNEPFSSTIIDALPILIAARDVTTGCFIFWNKQLEQMTGLEALQVIGATPSSLLCEEQAALFFEAEQEALAARQPIRFVKLAFPDKNNSLRVLEVIKALVSIDPQSPVMVTVAQDITDYYQAEQKVVVQSHLSQDILDSIDNQIAVLDHQGKIVAVNRSWLDFARANAVSDADLIGPGSNYFDLCCGVPATSPEHAEATRAFEGIRAVIAGQSECFLMEYECSSPGQIRYYLMRVLPLRYKDGKSGNSVVVSHIDITERKKAEALLKQNYAHVEDLVHERTAELQLFEKIFKSALEGITVTDVNGNIVSVNEAFTKITGYSREEVIGKNPRILKSDRHDHDFYRHMWEQLMTDGCWEGEIWNRRKSGEVYPEWLTINAIKNSDNKVTNYVAVFHDITQMKEKDEKITELAYQDPLTGLPNRAFMFARLEIATERARRKKRGVVLLHLDVDNFKNINDLHGYAKGDTFLCAIADHLSAQVRNGDTVAHIGGDEFAIIGTYDDENAVPNLVERLHHSFNRPVKAGDELFKTTVSIGVATFPTDGDSPLELIQKSGFALRQAKKDGQNCFCFFDKIQNNRVLERLKLEDEIRQALINEDLVVHYQPQVDTVSGRVVGCEALVRWRKTDGTLVPPDLFISVAEEMKIIRQLDLYVMNQACHDLRELHRLGYDELSISLNMSAAHFEDIEMVSDVMTLAYRYQIDPKFVELEITETAMMKDIRMTEKILERLSRNHFKISIDDFGTGYSSLYYLKRLPINAVKIDRSFIRELTIDNSDQVIVSAILNMAQTLGIKTVAEGVEELPQLNYLKNRKCDKIQGYFFSKPLPIEDLKEYLRRHQGGNSDEAAVNRVELCENNLTLTQ